MQGASLNNLIKNLFGLKKNVKWYTIIFRETWEKEAKSDWQIDWEEDKDPRKQR